MENRGRKRSELDEHLPADKRACSEAGPSSSTHPDCDMDSSSSVSVSGSARSELDADRDSPYGSCDSDGIDDGQGWSRSIRDAHRRVSSENYSGFMDALSSLNASVDPSDKLGALTSLCDVLSLSNEDTLIGLPFDTFVPRLVALANEEGYPEVMLLAIRAITYLCDCSRQATHYLVKYDAIPALCMRLMMIEYLDVAEQCLQALKKIADDHPVVCLNAGAMLAVLNYIDFFSTSVQRIAVSTVAKLCEKLPSDCSPHLMNVIPILCNLLRYEDQTLVETIALILKRIVACSSCTSEMMDELCKHGVIHQSAQLLVHSRMTLCQQTYTGLIELLARLASGSLVAVRTLFELNISSTLKDILTGFSVSCESTHSYHVGMHSNQIYEVLKLLNELLPLAGAGEDSQGLDSDKEQLLVNQSEFLHQFGLDILPLLIQVVGSGANLTVCYGCLSVMNKIVYFSSADMLLELFNQANISSFLASVLAQCDHHHVLILALRIADICMQKLPETFPNSFVKEGCVYVVDALLMCETSPESAFLKYRNIDKSSGKFANRCLCYSFQIQRSSSSEKGTCKLEKDTVCALAQHLKATYFGEELNSQVGLTESIQKLRALCALLSNDLNRSSKVDGCADEDYYSDIVGQMMIELNGENLMSTFEFIESGAVKYLAHYLSHGKYLEEKFDQQITSKNVDILLKRWETFVKISFKAVHMQCKDTFLTLLVRKLQSALSSLEHFPVIASHAPKLRDVYANIPGCVTKNPCFRVRFVKEEGEMVLSDHSLDVFTVDAFTSFEDIERFLWPKISKGIVLDPIESKGKDLGDDLNDIPKNSEGVHTLDTESKEVRNFVDMDMQDVTKQGNCMAEASSVVKKRDMMNVHTLCRGAHPASRLIFSLNGKELNCSLTLYQAILQQGSEDTDVVVGPKFWYDVYEMKYRRTSEKAQTSQDSKIASVDHQESCHSWQKISISSNMLAMELPCSLDRADPTYDVFFLLKFLEALNRCIFQLMSHERIQAFADGKLDNLDNLKVAIPTIPQAEFVSSRLSDKLKQQMQDPLAVSIAGMPSWCSQIMNACPFLFSFDSKTMYFRLSVFGSSKSQPQALRRSTVNHMNGASNRQPFAGGLQREKFHVDRSHIMDSAAQIMNLQATNPSILEVEFHEEVGTGLGPTMEFYTLVSHQFRRADLGMWRDNHWSQFEGSNLAIAPLGLFPRPWSAASSSSNGVNFPEVINKFLLLGKIVAKAIKDKRVMDLPFSKAFYKLMLEQELNIYDIHSFDPELEKTLLEFQALVERKRTLESVRGENSTSVADLHFRGTRIEDMCLDFTLPGFNDYEFDHPSANKLVNSLNMEEYVSFIVDATVKSGISKQVEAFKNGFNQVFPLKSLQIFTEDEIDRLLCGEQDTWAFGELLDHIKFDHGYTASSPPISNFLEIIREFGSDERRAFLQFVTGAPRLPPGGLAALNPKLTIVHKHWSERPDADLPSVMTCANYLKLPSYSSKERMRERLLYAITEGQGSFYLS